MAVLLVLPVLPALTAPPVAVGTPPPASRDSDWALTSLGAPGIWQRATGRGVTVAVIDSGVDASLPALAGRVDPGTVLAPGERGDGRRDTDARRHGTVMAAVIAAAGVGPVRGVAPDARILPIRVESSSGRAAPGRVYAEAVEYAVRQGAGVVNLSIGTGNHPEFAAALRRAAEAGVVVVAAAGNDEVPGAEVYPAAMPGVLAVSGVDRAGRFWPRSGYGRWVRLAAPAVDVRVPDAGGHRLAKGTSEATALVSGVAALLRQAHPEWTGGQVVRRLLATAVDRGPAGLDQRYGHGVVDPVRALAATGEPGPADSPLLEPLPAQVPLGAEPSVAPARPADRLPWGLDSLVDWGDPKSRALTVAGGSTLALLVLVGVPLLVAKVRRRRYRRRLAAAE